MIPTYTEGTEGDEDIDGSPCQKCPPDYTVILFPFGILDDVGYQEVMNGFCHDEGRRQGSRFSEGGNRSGPFWSRELCPGEEY
jgi:hypothetical protein